jgi:hypothetical protein
MGIKDQRFSRRHRLISLYSFIPLFLYSFTPILGVTYENSAGADQHGCRRH